MQNMQNIFNPMANIYQTQLEASRQFADAIFSGTEKIDHVLLEATHRAFTEQMKFAQSLVAVRDTQGVTDAQTMFLSQRPDRAMDYQRELIRVFSEVQNELGQSMRKYVEQLSSTAVNGAAAAASSAATDGHVNDAFNPMTGMFSVWESAFREVASLANKNMEAARNTFENTAGTAFSETSEMVGEAIDDAEDASAGHRRKSPAANHHKRK